MGSSESTNYTVCVVDDKTYVLTKSERDEVYNLLRTAQARRAYEPNHSSIDEKISELFVRHCLERKYGS